LKYEFYIIFARICYQHKGSDRPSLLLRALTAGGLPLNGSAGSNADAELRGGNDVPDVCQTYLINATSGGIVGGVLFVDDSFARIQGTAKFDKKTGAITSFTGTFIQSGVLSDGCFSQANLKPCKDSVKPIERRAESI
jgi:hypothetical protein